MARKPRTPPRRGSAAGARRGGATRRAGRRPTDRDRIVSAALTLAAAAEWRKASLADIAAGAGLSLAEAHAAFPSKAAILTGILRRIDEQVLAGGDIDDDASARDRLFEILMRRFDALAPHKKAIVSILGEICADPLAFVCAAPGFLKSMAWMLEAAQISSAGVLGAARTKGLALIYANALRVWLGDETPDMAPTMAALDRGLRRAEQMTALCGLGRREPAEQATSPG